jgi:hypothetical protein
LQAGSDFAGKAQAIQHDAILWIHHADEEKTDDPGSLGRKGVDRRVDPARLRFRQDRKELATFVCGKQQALTAVGIAGSLLDIAIVDQLPENPSKTLFGDLKDIEEVRHRHAGPQIDEIKNAVVCPAKSLPLKQCVCIASEITVSEEKQTHYVQRQAGVVGIREIYVSLIDIFSVCWHSHSITGPDRLIPKAFRFAKGWTLMHDRYNRRREWR